MKSKKAWIRIVEAFTTILLITGVLLIVLNKGYLPKEDISQGIYEEQQWILREIQLNDSLRESVLSFDLNSLPIEWDNFPQDLKDKIISKTPGDLECIAKICNINEICVLSEISDKDIYAQKVIITATLEKYSPRQLKLFCWRE